MKQAAALDLSAYIERRFFHQRPHVWGRRLPVAVLAAAAYENGEPVEEIMHDYSLREVAVLAALLYDVQHKAEIDAQETTYRFMPSEAWIEHGDDAVLFRRDDAPKRGGSAE